MKPLTKVDVSNQSIHNAFVRALFNNGFRVKIYGNKVFMVKSA